MSKVVTEIWVCRCCLLSHANGECCSDDTHGGDGIAPWALDLTGYDVAMGGTHVDDCDRDDNTDCDCERREFSRAQCEGCGSYLAGERHLFTLFAAK